MYNIRNCVTGSSVTAQKTSKPMNNTISGIMRKNFERKCEAILLQEKQAQDNTSVWESTEEIRFLRNIAGKCHKHSHITDE